MDLKWINLGSYTYIPAWRIVSVMNIESRVARELKARYKNPENNERHLLLDFSGKNKAYSCILLDTGHIALSFRSEKNIYNQLMAKNTVSNNEEDAS